MIPVFKPSMGNEEVEAVREVIESGWIGLGPKTQEFENKFAEYVGAKHAIALNSGTAALHLALLCSDVSGKTVATSSMTFISTTIAPLYCGASPKFIDIEDDTLNINPMELKNKIDKDVKVILPVHFGGHPCDMEIISEIAKYHDTLVIEDAAHACGSKYKNKRIGGLSDMTCFSFHAVKNLATGDGGMITTNSDDLAARLRKLRWVGIDKDTWNRSKTNEKYSWYYEVGELGYKYHMNDISAAIGLIQLEKLDKANSKRRKLTEAYNEEFASLDWLITPVQKEWASSSNHNYVIKVNNRDDYIKHMEKNGISCGVHYMPNHMHPIFESMEVDLPVTERVWKKLVSLPLYPDMTDEDFKSVVKATRDFNGY